MGSVDDAVAALPSPSREAVARVVEIARRVAPDATDGTSYGLPALKVSGKGLVGFSVAAQHLSVVPFSATAVDAVRDELDPSAVSKGMVRFTPDAPLPDDVVERLVRARLAEIVGP